jgi:hypothetical protein
MEMHLNCFQIFKAENYLLAAALVLVGECMSGQKTWFKGLLSTFSQIEKVGKSALDSNVKPANHPQLKNPSQDFLFEHTYDSKVNEPVKLTQDNNVEIFFY